MTMCRGAGPAIVGSVLDHAGALRILLDIANGVAEMSRIEHAGERPLLP